MNTSDFQELVEKKRGDNPVWFALDTDPPAAARLIEAAETRMGVRFPDEFRFFLLNYGGGYFAFANVFSVDPDSEWNIEARNAQIPPDIRSMFVAISDPGTGDYYGFRVNHGGADPSIWVYDHDSGTLKVTDYSDVFEYLADVALQA